MHERNHYHSYHLWNADYPESAAQEMNKWEINGGVLEYIDDTHTYLYDGVVVPSVTQLLQKKFGSKYDGIPKNVLERAAERGTALHKAIEDYEQLGTVTDLVELHNWIALKVEHEFQVMGNELPVVLFDNGKAVAAGRCDLFLANQGVFGLGDIKRTYRLDRKYLAYQLNLYRVAFMQSYGVSIDFLRGIHLRENISKYVEIQIDESLATEILNMEE